MMAESDGSSERNKKTTNVKVIANKSKASCCVPMCDITGYIVEQNTKITFHKLPQGKSPKQNKLMKTWLHKIRRDPGPNFKISKYTTICSRHFHESDFSVTKKGRRFVKKEATPSIFPWTKRSPNEKKCRKRLSSTCTSTPTPSLNEFEKLKKEYLELQQQLKTQSKAAELFKMERDKLKRTLTLKGSLSIENIKHDDKLLCFHNGFPTYNTFKQCLAIIDPGINGQNIIYVGEKLVNGRKRKRKTLNKKLPVEDEFLLMLVRLRLGLFVEDLAIRFGVSKTTINRIVLSWINYVYLKLGNISIWPTQETIKSTMPASMKAKYPTLEWIIDAFEIQTERPSALTFQSQSYSTYKSRNTLKKGLLACTPSGQIGFISQLYHGSMSDRELTIRSGFMKMPHNRGTMWLVDKGFLISDLAEPLGVHINMPAFVGANMSQMSKEEVYHTQQVASERIHIERAINKVKNFHIFDSCFPLTMAGSVNQIWTVCALLTLFQRPIISA